MRHARAGGGERARRRGARAAGAVAPPVWLAPAGRPLVIQLAEEVAGELSVSEAFKLLVRAPRERAARVRVVLLDGVRGVDPHLRHTQIARGWRG